MTLQEWFEREHAPSKTEFAAWLETSPGYVADLCKGRRKPSLEMAFKIWRATHSHVPPSVWLTAA